MTELLWVHKVPTSAKLSQSSREEEAKIRRHVKSVGSRKTALEISTASQSACLAPQKQAFSRALRPNAELGRRSKLEQGRSSRITQFVARPYPVARIDRSLSPWSFDGSTTEHRSLVFFRERTSTDWSGWQDSRFWSKLAMQMAQQNKAIAHGLIGLAALHEGTLQVDNGSKAYSRKLASHYASSAIQALASHTLTHLEAIVSCIIMLSFQSLQYTRDSFRLLQSASAMLAEYDRQAKAASWEVEAYCRPLLARLMCRPCRMNEPRMVLARHIRRLRKHLSSTSSVPETMPLVPACFTNLAEARDCLQSIFDPTCEHLASQSSPTADILQKLQSLQQAWHSALVRTAVTTSCLAASELQDRTRNLLKMSCLFGTMILQVHESDNEMVYDQHTDTYRQIIELAEQSTSVSQASRQIHSFGIDDGLIDIIAFAGHKCRDPDIRRRAVRLLYGSGRVDGDRIAWTPARIIQAQIELEEHGLQAKTCRDVPESRRRRLLAGHQYFAQGHIKLMFVKSPYKPELGARVDTCFVELPGVLKQEPGIDVDQDDVPDTIFGTGFASFLENRASRRYFHVESNQFFFPIPRT